MSEFIVSGAIGAALKRLPVIAAARKAFAEDLRRLHRINPELAREMMLRARGEPDTARNG
ncbi:MAG: hypothetical protein ACLQJR_01260 [Stellaceae bacterium]